MYPSSPSPISGKLFTLFGNHAAHLSFQYRAECAEWTLQSGPRNENVYSGSPSWKEAPLEDSGSLIGMLLNAHVSINARRKAFESAKAQDNGTIRKSFNIRVGASSWLKQEFLFHFIYLFLFFYSSLNHITVNTYSTSDQINFTFWHSELCWYQSEMQKCYFPTEACLIRKPDYSHTLIHTPFDKHRVAHWCIL